MSSLSCLTCLTLVSALRKTGAWVAHDRVCGLHQPLRAQNLSALPDTLVQKWAETECPAEQTCRGKGNFPHRKGVFIEAVLQPGDRMSSFTLAVRFFTGEICILKVLLGFPGGSVVKNLPNCAGNERSIPGSEDPWSRKWQPSPVFLPGESHGQMSLVYCSPWDHKESEKYWSDWAYTSMKYYHCRCAWMELSLYNSLWCGWDWNPQLLSKASGMIEQSPLLPWRNHEWVPNKGTGQATKWWWVWDEKKKKKVWFFLQKTDYFCVGALLVWVAVNTDTEEVLCMCVCICIRAQHTCKWVKVIWLNYMPHSLS